MAAERRILWKIYERITCMWRDLCYNSSTVWLVDMAGRGNAEALCALADLGPAG